MKRMGVLYRCCLVAVVPVLAACNPQDSDAPLDVLGGAAMSDDTLVQEKPQAVVLPDGAVVLRGQVVGGGAPCVQFRTEDGQQISLEGASAQDYAIGDRFEITGQFVALSRCMQGPGFVVTDQNALPEL